MLPVRVGDLIEQDRHIPEVRLPISHGNIDPHAARLHGAHRRFGWYLATELLTEMISGRGVSNYARTGPSDQRLSTLPREEDVNCGTNVWRKSNGSQR